MNNFFWACSASPRLSKEEQKDVASVCEERGGGWGWAGRRSLINIKLVAAFMRNKQNFTHCLFFIPASFILPIGKTLKLSSFSKPFMFAGNIIKKNSNWQEVYLKKNNNQGQTE